MHTMISYPDKIYTRIESFNRYPIDKITGCKNLLSIYIED